MVAQKSNDFLIFLGRESQYGKRFDAPAQTIGRTAIPKIYSFQSRNI